VKLLIVEPFPSAKKPADYVAHQIGAKLLILPEKSGRQSANPGLHQLV